MTETVGESAQLQSVVGTVTATTKPYTGSCSKLHVPHPREEHMYVNMSVCIELN